MAFPSVNKINSSNHIISKKETGAPGRLFIPLICVFFNFESYIFTNLMVFVYTLLQFLC